jgi:hypothetical protein
MREGAIKAAAIKAAAIKAAAPAKRKNNAPSTFRPSSGLSLLYFLFFEVPSVFLVVFLFFLFLF